MSRYFCEGISVDTWGNVVFNYDKDEYDDIIMLTKDSSGITEIDEAKVFYAYQYNPNCNDLKAKRKVREVIKQNINQFECLTDDVWDFIETGVLEFDSKFGLDNYPAVVSIQSSKSTSSSSDAIEANIFNYRGDMTGPYGTTLCDIKLLKDTYENVQFNEDRAYDLLIENKFKTEDAYKEINKLKRQFEKYKSQNRLFQMKTIVPVCLRNSVSNFLKFANGEQEDVYKRLDGVNVLFYDDFLTTGTTVREAIRYLKSINPSVKITVFILIKQH